MSGLFGHLLVSVSQFLFVPVNFAETVKNNFFRYFPHFGAQRVLAELSWVFERRFVNKLKVKTLTSGGRRRGDCMKRCSGIISPYDSSEYSESGFGSFIIGGPCG